MCSDVNPTAAEGTNVAATRPPVQTSAATKLVAWLAKVRMTITAVAGLLIIVQGLYNVCGAYHRIRRPAESWRVADTAVAAQPVTAAGISAGAVAIPARLPDGTEIMVLLIQAPSAGQAPVVGTTSGQLISH